MARKKSTPIQVFNGSQSCVHCGAPLAGAVWGTFVALCGGTWVHDRCYPALLEASGIQFRASQQTVASERLAAILDGTITASPAALAAWSAHRASRRSARAAAQIEKAA